MKSVKWCWEIVRQGSVRVMAGMSVNGECKLGEACEWGVPWTIEIFSIDIFSIVNV